MISNVIFCEKSNQLIGITRNTWGMDPRNTKLIYLQAIEPAILYGVQAWKEALNNTHIKKKLLSIQRKSVIRICRAYRTAPTDALLTIANLTPIHLKAKQFIWNWFILNNNFKQYSEDEITDLQKLGSLPPDNTKNLTNVIQQNIDYRPKSTNAMIDPRKKRLFEVNLDFSNTTHSGNQHLIAYTDGSRNDQGVGSDIVIKNKDKIIYQASLRLANECSIMQAELWAIFKTIYYVNNFPSDTHRNLIIYTDSRAALHTLNNKKTKSALATDLINLTNDTGRHKEIIFNWIPGHRGYEGNELADKLAKKAIKNSNITYSKLPISFIKNYVIQETNILWQREWNESATGRQCYRFIPSIEKRQQKKSFKTTFELTQCLTGHGAFNTYLHRFKKKSYNHCNIDINCEDSVDHFLFECTKYHEHRMNFERVCLQEGHNWPPKTQDLFACDKLLKAMTKFIRDSKALIPPIIENRDNDQNDDENQDDHNN
ncbi:uncharacterized protein [Centruroides vittatus]|uniref:uncharacterized protein n=1 Tax=Centruroides vittatus TaxID=120091 RepID=UPI00350F367F